MKVYAHKKDNSFLEFNLETEIKSGGEGAIFKIGKIPGFRGSFCAKIYHKGFLQKHKDEKHAKLSYMVSHRPKALCDDSGMIQICYPSFLLFDAPSGGNFVGYVMPFVPENSVDLQCLAMNISNTRFELLRKNGKPDIIGEEVFNKFPRPHNTSEIKQLTNRYKIIHNIASLIDYLHKDERFVIGDIKPENIMMTPQGGVFLVDVDSVQITDNGKVLFPSETTTPDYCPPDFLSNPKQAKSASYDLFSMAVLFYKILIGTHPYCYTNPNQQQQNDIVGNIMTGCFANGVNKNFYNLHRCHTLFIYLPSSIQQLFDRAFEGKPEERPRAWEWIKATSECLTPKVDIFSAFSDKDNNNIEETLHDEDDVLLLGGDKDCQEKTLCVILVDHSSVDANTISVINNKLQSYYQEILENGNLFRRIEIALVSCNPNMGLIIQPSLVEDFVMPTLSASKDSNLLEGIVRSCEIIANRKTYYRDHGYSYKRPWIIIISDGDVDAENLKSNLSSIMRIRDDAHKYKRFFIQPIAISEKANMDVLEALATHKAIMLKDAKFRELFMWLSSSMV